MHKFYFCNDVYTMDSGSIGQAAIWWFQANRHVQVLVIYSPIVGHLEVEVAAEGSWK